MKALNTTIALLFVWVCSQAQQIEIKYFGGIGNTISSGDFFLKDDSIRIFYNSDSAISHLILDQDLDLTSNTGLGFDTTYHQGQIFYPGIGKGLKLLSKNQLVSEFTYLDTSSGQPINGCRQYLKWDLNGGFNGFLDTSLSFSNAFDCFLTPGDVSGCHQWGIKYDSLVSVFSTAGIFGPDDCDCYVSLYTLFDSDQQVLNGSFGNQTFWYYHKIHDLTISNGEYIFLGSIDFSLAPWAGCGPGPILFLAKNGPNPGSFSFIAINEIGFLSGNQTQYFSLERIINLGNDNYGFIGFFNSQIQFGLIQGFSGPMTIIPFNHSEPLSSPKVLDLSKDNFVSLWNSPNGLQIQKFGKRVNILWSLEIGRDSTLKYFNIKQLSDSTLGILGKTGSSKNLFFARITDPRLLINTVQGEDRISDIRIYPNPVSGILHVQGEGMIKRYKIINMLGQTVEESSPDRKPDFEIDLRRLASGTYILMVESLDRNPIFKKFLKL